LVGLDSDHSSGKVLNVTYLGTSAAGYDSFSSIVDSDSSQLTEFIPSVHWGIN
jgi:hypothetical protein